MFVIPLGWFGVFAFGVGCFCDCWVWVCWIYDFVWAFSGLICICTLCLR